MERKNVFGVKSLIFVVCMITALVYIMPAGEVKADPQATYYVDPVSGNDNNVGTSPGSAFKTIAKARDIVDTINGNMSGDIYVYLRGGTYTLTSTLTFCEEDSGTNGYNVIYRNYDNEEPVISGGKQITGWSLYDAGKNIYRAYAGGDIETRQFYVNGFRAIRARSTATPSGWTYQGASGYTSTDIAYASWGNQDDIELVYNIEWSNPRCGISSIANTGSSLRITMDAPGWDYVRNKSDTSVGGGHNTNGLPWYIENAYELLDSPGEWYLDRSTDYFYYIPRTGEDLSTAAVTVPTVEKLVTVQGSAVGSPVSNIQFRGITFSYSTWLKPNGTTGHSDVQNNVLRETVDGVRGNYIIDAAVSLKYAKSMLFERCNFTRLGAIGLSMYAGCQDNMVRGCHFSDLSGGGVQIGNYWGSTDPASENYIDPSDTRLILRNNDVVNNLIHDIGVEYRSATAVAVSYPQDMDVLHNELYNLPYTGVHVAFGTSSFTTCMKDNRISYNYIHDYMTVLTDGGGIYNFGAQEAASVISYNYLRNDLNYQATHGGAIYPDQYSCYFNIAYNVIENTPKYVFINSTSNNTIDNTYTNQSSYSDVGTSTKTNTHVEPGAPPWSSNAQNIINNAGLEASYQDIKNGMPIDAAKGKNVTPSSTWQGYPAYNAVDDKPSTLWHTQSGATDEWLSVDLESARVIKGIEVHPRRDMDQSAYRRNFEIQASNDSGYSSYVVLASCGSEAFLHRETWKAPVYNTDAYRYVRLKRTVASGINLSEFRIFAEEGGGATPTPIPTPGIDTFENDTVGQVPAGYTEAVAGTCRVSNIYAYAGNNSLRIHDTSTSSTCNIVKTTSPSASKVVEFKIYPDSAPYGNMISICRGGNDNTNAVFHFGIFSDGSLKYYDGSWKVLAGAGSVAFDAWNTVRIEAGSTASANVYLNSQSVGTAGNWQSYPQMDRLRFQGGQTAGTGDDFYVDDVSFTNS